MLTITLSNEAGPLVAEQANTFAEAATVAAKMISDAGELYAGDMITVSGEEE